jgi:hypothetical protein
MNYLAIYETTGQTVTVVVGLSIASNQEVILGILLWMVEQEFKAIWFLSKFTISCFLHLIFPECLR